MLPEPELEKLGTGDGARRGSLVPKTGQIASARKEPIAIGLTFILIAISGPFER